MNFQHIKNIGNRGRGLGPSWDIIKLFNCQKRKKKKKNLFWLFYMINRLISTSRTLSFIGLTYFIGALLLELFRK